MGKGCDSHARPQIMTLRGHTNMDMIGCIYDNPERPEFKKITDRQLQRIYEKTGCKSFDQRSSGEQSWRNRGTEMAKSKSRAHLSHLAFDASERVKFLTKETK